MIAKTRKMAIIKRPWMSRVKMVKVEKARTSY